MERHTPTITLSGVDGQIQRESSLKCEKRPHNRSGGMEAAQREEKNRGNANDPSGARDEERGAQRSRARAGGGIGWLSARADHGVTIADWKETGSAN